MTRGSAHGLGLFHRRPRDKRPTVGIDAAMCAVGIAAALAYLAAQRRTGRRSIPA